MMFSRICFVLVLYIPLCFSQTESPFGKPVQVYFKSEIPNFGYVYGGLTAFIQEAYQSNHMFFEKFQLYKTFPQQHSYFFNAINEDLTHQQNTSCTGAIQEACSVDISHADPGEVDFQLVIDGNYFHISTITVTDTKISRTDYECKNVTIKASTSACICDDGIYDNQCDTIPANCSVIAVEPMKDLSSNYLQFQVKLNQQYQKRDVDQYIYVFDDSSNEFYSISYGPVESTVLMKPLQLQVFQLRVFFAKMPNFDHDKTSFLNKNFIIDNAAIFHDAFCTLTSGVILDCSCCEDYKRASLEVAPQCKFHASDSGNEALFYFSALQTVIVFGEGIVWIDDEKKNLYVRVTSMNKLDGLDPKFLITINQQEVYCNMFQVYTGSCWSALGQETEIYLKILTSDPSVPKVTVAYIQLDENRKIELEDQCRDTSSRDNEFSCRCKLSSGKDTNCKTLVKDCEEAHYDATLQIDGTTFKNPAFFVALDDNVNKDNDQYTHMKSSNNDKAYTVSYKRVKEPALYPQMNQTYSFDVIVGSTTLQKSGTDLTTNIAIENSKEAYRFPAQFCRITSLKNLRCVCCKKGLPDDQCLTDPQYDVHFFSYISSYGYVEGNARVWTTFDSGNDVNAINVLFNVFSATFSNGDENILPLKGVTNGGFKGEKDCKSNELCVVGIFTDATEACFNFSSQTVFKVAINSDSKIVGPTDQSCKQIVPFTDNLKVCVCPVGYPMNENCNFDEPISCSKTRPINSGVPLITFQDSAFQKPQPNNDKRIYINSQADNQYYSLKYEPIQGFADTRPNNKDSFLMNLTIGNIKSLNTQGVQKDGTVQFEAAIFKTYIFKNAFCSINDNNVVQCACCETNPDDNACVQQAPTLLSDVTFVFSSVVDAYGLITGSGKIQLNSRKELWLNGQKLKALFEQNFIIVLSTIKADKVTKIGECNPWSNCKLQMTDENLADDAILIRTQIQDSKASTLLRLELENGLIKSEQNTCTKLTQGCVCSNDHPADSNCPSVNPIACNLGIVNTNTVDGIPYPFEAFSIVSKTELKKPTTEMIYGYAKDKAQKFYSLVYTDMKTISETSVSVNLEIGPMSSAPVNQNDVMDVALNFDVNTNVIDFSTAKCVLMTSKKLDCFCAPVLPVFPTSTTREATTMTTVSTTLSPDNPCLNPSDVKTNDLCGILDHQINSTNLDQKVGETRDLLEKNQTTADDLNVVSQIVDKMANVQDASSEQRKNVLSLCDNVLAINAPTFDEANKQTKDRFLKSIDKIVTTSTDDLEYLNGNQFGLHKTSVGCQNDKDGWAGIADDGQKFKKTEETNDQVASIELDKSKLCSATTGESRGVYFVIFRNSKLFSQDDDETVDNQKRTKRSTNFQLNADDVKSSKSNVDRCKMQFHETNGMVLTSVLLDGNQTGSVNARMKFKKDTNATNLPTHSNLVVTWYDENDWSTERQCEMREENGEFVAHCNHLTSFALLIQRSSTDPILCNNFLDRLGFWLVIASTTCLCILFFIYLTRIIPSVKENILIRMLNNSLRPSADSFIVLYVCIMLLFYLLFLVFVDQSLTGSHIVCKLSAAVLYDLFLTALIVNLFQAWNLIRVCAWSSRMEYLLGILTRPQIGFPIALFLPFLTCLIIWFTDYGFFYRGDQYCWIRPQSIIYAVLIPVTIMLVNSIFTFIIFCLRMFPSCTKICGSSSSAVRISTGSKNKRSGKLQLFIAILFAQFVLGFPWLLQYPAMFSSTTTVWHYLFAILNGSNGIILLLMYIYGRAQAFRRIQSLNSINSGLGTVRTHDYDRSQ